MSSISIRKIRFETDLFSDEAPYEFAFLIHPSNETIDGTTCPLHGVRLLNRLKRPPPVAPAYAPVPPVTRKVTPCEFEATQMAGLITCTKESPSMKT